jgi:hypothetical protein
MRNVLLALLVPLLSLIQVPVAGAQTGGAIEGRIIAMDGSPAADVRVAALVVPEGPAAAGTTIMAAIVQTDSAGRFSLGPLVAGRYYIAAGSVVYPTYYPGVKAMAQARIVAVTAASPVTGIEFRLAPGPKVSGRVIQEGDAPPPSNQQVNLVGAGRPLQSVTPKSDGSFEFADLVPGKYSIGLSAGWTEQNIVVSDTDLKVELLAPLLFAVSSRVIVEAGAARPELGLSFENVTTQLSSSFYPANGAYSVVLPRGTYRVKPVLRQAGISVKSMTSGSVDLLRDSLVVSGEGTPGVLVTLFATPMVDVPGRVVFSGPAFSPLRFRLAVPNGVGQSIGAGVRDGRFSLTLPAGSHRLSLETPPPGYTVKSMTYGTANLLTSNIVIDPAAIQELTLLLDPDPAARPVKVSGTVSGRLPSEQVSIVVTGKALIQARTGPDGAFELPEVVPGSYTVRVTTDASPRLTSITTLVAPSTGLTNVEFKIPGYRMGAGRLAPVDGEQLRPVFWFNLTESNTSHTMVVHANLSPDGSFRSPLPEGEWRVTVGGLAEGLRVKSLTYGAVDLQRSAVRFSATDTQELQLSLELSGTRFVKVSGRIVGAVQQSATIRLIGRTTAEATLNADGSFEFPRLLPGSYSWGSAYGSALITVPDSDVMDLTIRLVKGRVIRDESAASAGEFYLQANNGAGDNIVYLQSDGSFVLPVVEGAYRLSITTVPNWSPAGLYFKSIRYGEDVIANQMLTVPPGEETRNLQIEVGRR